MESKGRIKDIAKDILSGKYIISFETDSIGDAESLKNTDIKLVVKKWRKKRSLDANAYFWVLLDKLAVSLKIPKEDLYRGYIRNIGGNNETACVQNKAVDAIVEGWQHNGTGWLAETNESKIPGCTNLTLYSGSSTYDSEQMSRLIDAVVQDCKAVGIETMTPQELEQMLGAWK